MASNSDRRIALLPIHPRFAQSIMASKKRVEFRKVRFRSEVSHIVLYATAPLRKVLGYFEVSHVDQDSPDALWVRYGAAAGMLREEFEAYFQCTTQGVAIGVGRVYCLGTPLPLVAVDQSLRPPQSFRYLTPEAFEAVCGLVGLPTGP